MTSKDNFQLSEKELRFALAKAALTGGQSVSTAAAFYRWVTDGGASDNDLSRIPVGSIIPDLEKVGVSFSNRCRENGIETIADLVRIGSQGFRDLGGVGPTTYRHVADALRRRYGIVDW